MSAVIDNSSRRNDSSIRANNGAEPYTYDPTGGAARSAASIPDGYRIVCGTVIRAGAGGHECSVQVGAWEMACRILSRNVSNGFGVVDGWIPIEGTEVFVLMRGSSYSDGWIIGAAPNSKGIGTNGPLPEQPQLDPLIDDPFSTCPAYSLLYDVKNGESPPANVVWAGSNKPYDMIPGEYCLLNESSSGLHVGKADMTIMSGASFIRLGCLDDEARIRSGNFTRWSDATAVSEFNDAGCVTSESRAYAKQGELFGNKGRKANDIPKEYPDVIDAVRKLKPAPRFRKWLGYLGNMLSWFAVRPREDREDVTDDGLVSVHTGKAGNVMVRAAGGISIERYDKLPVPIRKREPWDPEGDDMSGIEPAEPKPFTLDDPHARGIAESSKIAWEQAEMYRRVDELKKDFKVRNENDVEDLDPSDPFDGTKEVGYVPGAKAGIFIGEDGSVIIRDAWGSEIVMLGGNITMSAPGTITRMAHGNIVEMAGGSYIARGRKASELTSDEGSVRIHSPMMVAIAGGTDKTDGGVLIESLSKSPSLNAGKDAGDGAMVGGVVIRSEKSDVAIMGSRAHVVGKEAAFVTGGGDGDNRDGDVYIAGKTVAVSAGENLAAVVGGNGLLIGKEAAVLHAKRNGFLHSDISAMAISGRKVPVMWDGDAKPTQLTEVCETVGEALQDTKSEEPFTWDNVSEKAEFTFRKSKDCGTDRGTEPWKPNPQYTVYEPYWQTMRKVGDRMAVGEEPVKPQPGEVNGTKCWPGKEAFSSGKFKSLSGTGNLEKGYSKARDVVKPSIDLDEAPYSDMLL